MHESVLQFVAKHIGPSQIKGKSILEVGSANINGSVRPQLEAMDPSLYLGIDLALGPGVDVVTRVEDFTDGQFDLVISCEMLEHACDWRAAFRQMCHLTRDYLVLTCRGPGFPYHNPPDYWRFTPSDLWRASLACGMTPTVCTWDPQVPGVFLVARKSTLEDIVPLPSPGGQWQ